LINHEIIYDTVMKRHLRPRSPFWKDTGQCPVLWLPWWQNRCGLVWAVMINPPELPINDETRNDAHISSTSVRLY